jgi:hypothetical protein
VVIQKQPLLDLFPPLQLSRKRLSIAASRFMRDQNLSDRFTAREVKSRNPFLIHQIGIGAAFEEKTYNFDISGNRGEHQGRYPGHIDMIRVNTLFHDIPDKGPVLP